MNTAAGRLAVEILEPASFTANPSTVLCWPSMMGDSESMRCFARNLADSRERPCRVILIDPPGFGMNRHVTRWPTFSDMAGAAQHIIDELGLTKVHWVGQGYGGHLGAVLIERMHAPVVSLTLVSTPLVSPLRLSMISRALTSAMLRTRWGIRLVGRRYGRQLGGRDAAQVQATIDCLTQVLLAGNPSVIPQLRPVPANRIGVLRKMLQTSRVPKLVLAGQHDQLCPARDQHTIAELMPCTRFALIDSGFMALLLQPADCADAFRAFLVSIPQQDLSSSLFPDT